MTPTDTMSSHQATARIKNRNLYADYVNPEWARLLELLEMNVEYERCEGTELFAADGRIFLDFLSGYCVHNTGHNHPYIVQALRDELLRSGPAMLQSHVPESAGALAKELCDRAGGQLKKVFFCSSGSEGIESVIKFARAHTRRDAIVYATGAFHGLTCGALSLMGNEFWRHRFGPLLDSTIEVPFGDLKALRAAFGLQRIAAFVVEPIQGEAGIVTPPAGYLLAAEAICREHGALFVLDEVQTGMGRTGKFLAGHHFGVQPDMVVMAKALSGGLVPCAAVLMTDYIYDAVYGSLKRAIIHTSTYSENGLAMRAGLATLEVLDRDGLIERTLSVGNDLREQLRAALSPYEMVSEVRGMGLLNGIVFGPPKQTKLRLSFEACRMIHPAMFGQMIVRRLFKQHRILSQICGNNFMVLKVAPPLVVTQTQIARYLEAIQEVVEALHSSYAFWNEALQIATRALKV